MTAAAGAMVALVAVACGQSGGAAVDRLQRDEAELTRLATRLGVALDEHDFAALGAMFTPGAKATTPGGTAEGRERVLAQATANHEGYTRLQHVVSGILIDLDGDTATIRANLVGHYGRGDDPAPVRQLGAVYRFGAVRTTDGWQFESLTAQQVWRIENPSA
ncbi:nuclear transport factor 2 family protein [Nocardia sp. IFM 10818]